MNRPLTLASVAFLSATSCSPQEKPMQPEIETMGIDTFTEASDLVRQWEREGFTMSNGLDCANGLLWDSSKCNGVTPPNHANGVALKLIEINPYNFFPKKGVKVGYIRSCSDSSVLEFQRPTAENFLMEEKDSKTYQTFLGYIHRNNQ